MFQVRGMSCASCAMTIEGVLKKLEGVYNASLNFANESATVVYNPSKISPEDMIGEVKAIGYRIIPQEKIGSQSDIEDDYELKKAFSVMKTGWYLTLLVMLLMAAGHFIPMDPLIAKLHGFILAAVALAVIVFPGAKIFKSAFNSMKRLKANMDTLIALGTLSAFLLGAASIFIPVANFSGVSAMILTFHLSGKYVEAKAKGRASNAIKKLLQLGAKKARIKKGPETVEIPTEEIKIGDVMIIRPGEKIPTDAVVLKGRAAVDESMATGESFPVEKKEGDKLIGATINTSGLLEARAEKIGEETFLSQVVKMVREAQGSKVPVQEFADKVTSYFVPTVMAISVLTFILWIAFPLFFQSVLSNAASYLPWVNPDMGLFSLAVFAAVTVLVIACPCSLGLATPTALMVGSGLGAENGILIRSGAAIEIMKDIDTMVFDKTGTITEGKTSLSEIVTFNAHEDEILFYASSLESGSEHPLAAAIISEAQKRKIKYVQPDNFISHAGRGASGEVKGKKIKIGSGNFLKEYIKNDHQKKEIEKLQSRGNTVVLLVVDEKLIALIGIADKIKENAASVIKALNKMGFETILLTGDNKITAHAIAQQAGIKDVLYEVMPADKAEKIKELRAEGKKTLMTGDGINDAPALASADCSIAIGTGTDIAIESADITLVSGNLEGVLNAVKLSRATFKKIKQNLAWAFMYNLIAIPIAVMGLLHPVIGVSAMALSSVSVVTNANLLKKKKIFS
ncbi:MAG: heavy metal translocating P-type ATPase [Elusimicrobiota bacterium]